MRRLFIAITVGVGVVAGLGVSGHPGEAHEAGASSAAPVSQARIESLAQLARRLLDARLPASERRSAAAARLAQLVQLIQENPQEALRQAMPASTRSQVGPDLRDLVEDDQTHEGELSVLHADGPEPQEYLYSLLTTAGERLSLHIAQDAPALQTGTQVRVRGLRAGQVMALQTGAQVAVLAAPTLPSTLGAISTAVLLVSFSNQPAVTSTTASQATSVVFGTGGSVSEFYREASYQQTSLTGNVFGPYVIALTSAGCPDYNKVASQAKAAAGAAGVNLSAYRRLVFAFPTTGCSWWGLGTIGGSPGMAWINGSFQPKVVAHELGHNFGLYHSHAWECGSVTMGGSCSGIEYGDVLDTMGSSSTPNHFNAVQKELLGWLGYGVSPPITPVQSTGVYAVDPYETAGSNPKALKITTSAGDYYYVEYRRGAGFDANLGSNVNVQNGVVVHYWTGQRNGVYLLDMTPATSAWSDPALDVNGTFTDAVRGITITTAWADGTSAGVSVSVGGTCVRRNPSVSITPAQQQALAGATLSYTITVTNADSGCGVSAFAPQATLPAGWSGAFNPTSLSLASGATASMSLEVTSAASAAQGPYTITARVSNTAVPTSTGSGTASYSVVTSAPPGGAGTFSDNFDRPDAGTLGNGWVSVSGTLSVQSSEARSAATRTLHAAVQPGIAGADGTVQASFASTDNNGAPRFGVILRYQDPGNYYVCYRRVGGSSVGRIARVQNGVETVIKSVAMPNPTRNVFFTLSCQASGATLTLQVGSTRLSGTDATFSSGAVGLLMGYTTSTGSTLSQRADNFSAAMQ